MYYKITERRLLHGMVLRGKRSIQRFHPLHRSAPVEARCGFLAPSSGAMPHPSVTMTGVPAATASAAVLPKFSFCDGNTNTSASRYASHFAVLKIDPVKVARESTPSRAADCERLA